MLRGLTTTSFFTDDLDAATTWYTELFGVEPYFRTMSTPARPGPSHRGAIPHDEPTVRGEGYVTTSRCWGSGLEPLT